MWRSTLFRKAARAWSLYDPIHGSCLLQLRWSLASAELRTRTCPTKPIICCWSNATSVATTTSTSTTHASSTADNGSHSHQNHNPVRVSSAVRKWIKCKDRLLAVSPGSFSGEDWTEANDLLSALYVQRRSLLASQERQRLEEVFELLDRLKDEASFGIVGVQLPMDQRLLFQVLMVWQEETKSSFDQQSTLPRSLSVDTVLEKLENYLDAGLFVPDNSPYKMIVRAVAGTQDVDSLLEFVRDKIAPKGKAADGVYLYLLKYLREAKGPEDCEKMLWNLVELYPSQITPNHFRVAIFAWCDKPSPDGLQRAQTIFEKTAFENEEKSLILYNSLMKAWSLSGARDTPERAEKLYNQIIQRWNQGEEAFKPNTKTFSTLLLVLLYSSDSQALVRAEELFEYMQEIRVKPDVFTCNIMVTLWSTKGEIYIDKIEQLYEEMMEAYEQGDESLKPTFEFFRNFLNSLAKAGEPKKCAAVLKTMMELRERRLLEQKVTTELCGYMLHAHVHTRAANRGDRALEQLNAFLESGYFAEPDVRWFNLVLSVYISEIKDGVDEERMKEIISQARNLFQRMQHMGVIPDHITTSSMMTISSDGNDDTEGEDACPYSSKLDAFCRSEDPIKAEMVLNEWLSDCKSGIVQTRPSMRVFQTILRLWLYSKHPDAAIRAETILNQMDNPSVNIYNVVLAAYSKSDSPFASARALNLFRQLKLVHEQSGRNKLFRPDLITYEGLIRCLVKSKDHAHKSALKDVVEELSGKSHFFWGSTRGAKRRQRYIEKSLEKSVYATRSGLLNDFRKFVPREFKEY